MEKNIMRGKRPAEEGNVLLCALGTILVISLIGANVLHNCTTRFNVASSQVRSWKESLFAAEAGGDIAYAEVRKTVLDPTRAFNSLDQQRSPACKSSHDLWRQQPRDERRGGLVLP